MRSSASSANEAAGQFDLFASSWVGPTTPTSPFGNGPVFLLTFPTCFGVGYMKLAYERDMLGLYVSDHPLMGLRLLGKPADKEISEPTRTMSCPTAPWSPSPGSSPP